MYEALVFVHVLSAVIWLGGGVYAQVEMRKAFATEDRAAISQVMNSIERTTPIVFNVFPPLTLLAGVGLVFWSSAWEFGQFWIYGALGLVALSIVFGAVLTTKALLGAKEAAESGDSSSLSTAVARVTRFGNVDLLILLAILVLMVFKPGA